MEFMKTQKGREKICFKGYSYVFHKKNKEGTRWRCCKYGSIKCLGFLNIDLEKTKVLKEGEHVHPANSNQTLILKTIPDVRQKAKTTLNKPSQILTENLRDIQGSLHKHMPDRKSIKRTLRNQRSADFPKTPNSLKDLTMDGSFDWRTFLRKPKFIAAPVSCFKHVALSDCWDSVVSNVYVEIRSPDCKTCCTTNPCRYWLAHVAKIAGYMGLLQFVGFEQQAGHKWINLCTESHIHPVGWCSDNRKPLVPPKCIEDRYEDWKTLLVNRMSGFCTLPPNFSFKDVELSNNLIKKGMKLEVVDKNLISVVRPAKVSEVVGGRLHVVYIDSEMEDEGFWCHERSPLIHPVGWAQIIGHALKGQTEYARESLQKTLYRKFEPDDATWDMFLPVINPVRELRFKPGMKLEAIDPLNLSTICVATVTEVLRNNYLMIGIDGMMAANGADCFCYHASSPSIFPVGFCEEHDIILTPPRGYKGEFIWSDYLKKTKSEAAPVDLFHMDIPDHGFKENMYLEAVDLMEPRLICVAYITKVVGRLLRVHFEGWEDDYDQWCDCGSPDLFPVGWCDVLGYKLEPPRVDPNNEEKKKKKPGKRRRRRGKSKKVSDEEDDGDDDDENDENADVDAMSVNAGKKPEVRLTRRKAANGSIR